MEMIYKRVSIEQTEEYMPDEYPESGLYLNTKSKNVVLVLKTKFKSLMPMVLFLAQQEQFDKNFSQEEEMPSPVPMKITPVENVVTEQFALKMLAIANGQEMKNL